MGRQYRFYSNHQSTAEVLEIEVSPCMGASRNLGPSNNNPLVMSFAETGKGYWQEMGISSTLRAEGENRPSRPSNVIIGKKG